MARLQPRPAGRQKGSIDVLPSGALRVRVYAGQDPITKRRHNLVEIVPAGPDAEKQAYAVRDRMLRDIEERRSPRTSATVAHLLEKHLEQFSGAPNTLQLYRGYVKNHIEPLVGRLNPLAQVRSARGRPNASHPAQYELLRRIDWDDYAES